ncbi:MAG: NfeD family protein [Myxococcaceae bacterium]
MTFESPQVWQLWLVAGLVLGVLEMKLSGFVMLWFAVGAFAASVFAGLAASFNVQLVVFSIVSLALYGASRTIFKKVFMRHAEGMKQGVEAMLGADAQVTEAVPASGFGAVRVNGELWSARSLSGPIEVGAWVRIEDRDGLKLLVRQQAAPSHFPKKEGIE